MRRKFPEIPFISLLLLILILVLTSAAFADEGNKDDAGDEITVEETQDTQADETDVMEEQNGMDEESDDVTPDSDEMESMEVTYLDDAVTDEGSITVLFKIDDSGEDSPFFGRYHDPFAGESFYIDDIGWRGWDTGGSRFNFNIADSWDPSWRARAEFLRPGAIWGEVGYSEYRYFEIPSTNPANRHDFTAGIRAFGSDYDTFAFDYAYRDNRIRVPGESGVLADWNSNDADFGYAFNWAEWNASVELRQRQFDDNRTSLNDVEHTSGTLRLGRNIGDMNYIEGNIGYSVSDVYSGDDLEAFTFGGYGRFVNALGIDRFNLTSHFNWTDRNLGPSRMHPAGDSVSFDIEGRLRPASNVRLNGSYQYSDYDVNHTDQFTNLGFYLDPRAEEIDMGRFFQDRIKANEWTFGGMWRITDDLDFGIDLNWLDRDGLPETDLGWPGAPTLWWEAETRYAYTLRYNPHGRTGPSGSDFVLKYETEDRENGARDSRSSVEHFTANWTGTLAPDLWVYVGGGILNTDNTTMGVQLLDQEGTEFGGGWSWYLQDGWSFFGDYWTYDVGGMFGYDQTTFGAGLGYEMDENWTWTIEYERVEGTFSARPELDYEVDDLLLGVSFGW